MLLLLEVGFPLEEQMDLRGMHDWHDGDGDSFFTAGLYRGNNDAAHDGFLSPGFDIGTNPLLDNSEGDCLPGHEKHLDFPVVGEIGAEDPGLSQLSQLRFGYGDRPYAYIYDSDGNYDHWEYLD